MQIVLHPKWSEVVAAVQTFRSISSQAGFDPYKTPLPTSKTFNFWKFLLPLHCHIVHLTKVCRLVVWQTVGSIYSKTLGYDCCTHLNCALHRWLLPVNSDIWEIFWPVFVQAILKRVHCSALYNFIWESIPGCCYFNWVKLLENWCTEMFYNKFCSTVSCEKVVIEESSCTGSNESIQVFKHFN